MKKLLFFLLPVLFLAFNAKADTEPGNNAPGTTTDVITLGGAPQTGLVTVTSDDNDYLKIVSTADGDITLNVSAGNSNIIYYHLYDSDGTSSLGNNYMYGGSSSLTFYGLAAGTYFARVYLGGGADNTYSIGAVLTNRTYAPDSEPNDGFATANSMVLNGSNTGHINHRYNGGTYDADDWYSFTTNVDGSITLNITTENTNIVYFDLYDNDGTTQLGSNYLYGGSSSFTVYGLATGNYFIRIRQGTNGQYNSYTISNTLTPATFTTDAEPNSIYNNAISIPLNGSANGHISHRYNGGTYDTDDWYSFTTNVDGNITVSITTENTNLVYFDLYDNDGTTQLGSNLLYGGSSNFTISGLAAGNYFIRIRQGTNGQYNSYTIGNTLSPSDYLNDTENNDVFTSALIINPNDSAKGHIGHRYNGGSYDTQDWYKLVTTTDGNINVNIHTVNGNLVYFNLLDSNGTTNLGGSYLYGGDVGFTSLGLAAGTYYIQVLQGGNGQYNSYKLSNSFTPAFYANDAEPNNFFNNALPFSVNGTVTGHIGYRNNGGSFDGDDWYKIITTADGDISLNITTENGNLVYFDLYDGDTTTALAGTYLYGGSNSTSKSGLAAGTYYARVHFGSNHNSYTLTNTFTPTAYNNDTEVNNTFATATLLNNRQQKSGHIGHRYNGGSFDTDDYHILRMYSTGSCSFDITVATANLVYFYFYDPSQTQLYTTYIYGGTANFNFPTLAAGDYYLRIVSGGAHNAYTLNNFSVPCNPNAAVITAGGAITFCQPGSVVLNAQNTAAYPIYLWSNGASTSSITVSTSGTYNVTATDYDGCTHVSNSILVTANPLPAVPTITPVGSTTICQGGSVTLQSSASSGYLWSTGETTQNISVTTQGNYSVTVSNGAGCTRTSATTPVIVNALPAIPTITPNGPTTFCIPGSVTLQSSSANGYAWSNGASSQSIVITSSGTFTVTVSNANGCTRTSTTPITVTAQNCASFTFYRDADNDTYGNQNISIAQPSPTPPTGYVANNTDCNDNNAAINPGATEIVADGVDQDCNTSELCYTDIDNDDFGISTLINSSDLDCGDANEAYVVGDCNDNNAAINPLATEVCNSADDDCDGLIDEGVQNTYYRDFDNDTYGNPTATTMACSAPSGFVSNNTDCNDGSASVNPGAMEVCNGTDDDCDGLIDEGCNGCTNPPTVYAGMDQPICVGDNASLNATMGGGASSITWSSPTNGIFIPNVNAPVATYIPSATDITNGFVRLYITTNTPANCNAAMDSVDISILQLLATPGLITGSQYICNPSSTATFTYSVAPVPGATGYLWTAGPNTTIVSGQGSTSIVAKFNPAAIHNGISASICVAATGPGSCGTSATSCLPVSVQLVAPVTPGSISGPNKVCQGDTAIYSISYVARSAFFTWTVPANASIIQGQGTLTIKVVYSGSFNTGGDVTVTAGNGCGNSPARTRAILLNVLPAPVAISGQASGLCNEQNIMYSIAPVAGATSYQWSVGTTAAIDGPSTGTSVAVDFSSFVNDNISVVAINGCGAGATRSLAITGTPLAAGAISGPVTVCPGSTNTYQVNTVTGANNYNWTVPSGTTIINGQGTKIINLKFGNTTAYNMVVSVRTSNACGNGPLRSLNSIAAVPCAREALDHITVNVSPNPSSGIFFLDLSQLPAENVQLILTDLSGRMVFNKNIINEGSYETDITSLPEGIYMLQIISENYREIVKVIKN